MAPPTRRAIVAEAQNTSAAYGQLAFYLYFDLNFNEADAAAKKAVALADLRTERRREELAAYSSRPTSSRS